MRIDKHNKSSKEIIKIKENIKNEMAELPIISQVDVIGSCLTSYVLKYFSDILEKDDISEADKIHLGSLWTIFIGLLSIETSKEMSLPENKSEHLESYDELLTSFLQRLNLSKNDMHKLIK